MNHASFIARFPGTEIGRSITDTEVEIFFDNGSEAGCWRIDRRSTVGKGEILATENSHIARHYYRDKRDRANTPTASLQKR